MTFRTNGRIKKLIKTEDIELINNISNKLYNIEFNALPLNYKNIVLNNYYKNKK